MRLAVLLAFEMLPLTPLQSNAMLRLFCHSKLGHSYYFIGTLAQQSEWHLR